VNGVLKHMIEKGWIHDTFVADHTTGFEALGADLEKQSWEELEQQCGLQRQAMFDFAHLYVRAETAVFVWSMGITHHRFGVDNIRAIVNLGLAGGIVGRPKCGLMPIRGHSGVQGGSEMGATPKDYALGFPVGEENAARFERLWGFRPPTAHGMTAVGMIDAAHAGNLDVLYMAGGNFLETLPEPEYVREALGRVPLRIHQDIVLSSAMLVDPAYAVLLFPAPGWEGPFLSRPTSGPRHPGGAIPPQHSAGKTVQFDDPGRDRSATRGRPSRYPIERRRRGRLAPAGRGPDRDLQRSRIVPG